ncbi:MAG: L-2-amino-thiazoline-4-carboxylic acid hydrolase [Erysipelotrichaceae bacterium]|nr:L-2-amino-thiazoline-4-carboxylic acid hydrolase [Erysipelotrichaceae bacterium]
MAKQVRYFTQIVGHLNREFGQEKSEAIMAKALQRYDELLEENKDEAKECYMHTRERIYPAIACFDALLSEGVERKKAADFIVDYYKWRSGKLAPFIKKAFKIPGLYRIVPKFFMGITEKSFGPKAGFASKDHFVSKDEVRFNMTRCPYFEKCKQYGCTEIVRGFCDADDICYGHMHPKLSWDRTKTIGYGYDVCDFKVRIRQ